MMTLHDFEAGIKGQIWHLQKICRPQFSNRLFSHSKPLGAIIREILELLEMPSPIWHYRCDMVAIVFTKLSQNYSQASFPSQLHFLQIWHSNLQYFKF